MIRVDPKPGHGDAADFQSLAPSPLLRFDPTVSQGRVCGGAELAKRLRRVSAIAPVNDIASGGVRRFGHSKDKAQSVLAVSPDAISDTFILVEIARRACPYSMSV